MKRDVDLARQLLLDIEARGADCSVSVLSAKGDTEAEERLRYHLRLLVDAGYLKEIDRTSGGVPCLRLTDAGHELIELCRSDDFWREAKWACQERTGGAALAVIREILFHWAVEARPRQRRYARPWDADLFDHEFVDREFVERPVADIDPYGVEWDDDVQVRYIRVRPKHRQGWRRRAAPISPRRNGSPRLAPTLPEQLI